MSRGEVVWGLPSREKLCAEALRKGMHHARKWREASVARKPRAT